MLSEEYAIKLSSIYKIFKIYDDPNHVWREFIPFSKKKYHQEFYALSNICLEVKKGQTVGIIGRNGAGKSTLLELIAGTSQPTQGIVQKAGRVGALLELGSGFSPEFTGWENVRINAAILGLGKRELDEKMEEIVDFADIGSFIDRPLKMYSSGMIVRLAFAVQACLEPSILIVDEALAAMSHFKKNVSID